MSYKELVFPKDSLFLITGGAGFIGSNLCEAILNMGYKVRCLDNLSNGFLKNIEPFLPNPRFTFIKGDITYYQTCLQATEGVDYVLHQAAWGSVPRSIEMPLFYEQNNVMGTLNMMEASRQNQVKKFVYASSSSVYGDEPNLPKTEGREGNILSPYALTKRTNEEYGKLYFNLYGLETYGLRYFNVFGKRQNPDGAYAAVIPKWIRQFMNHEPPLIHGDGKQSRDFTYIENVIEANLDACQANSEVAGEVYNIASGEQIVLIEIYYMLSEVFRKTIDPIFTPTRVGDIKHSLADIEKAQKMIGYKPSYSFRKGFLESIDWYRNNL
ncbi:UDP-N-acetylglucosamine 4-epimerase [bioreactor metagenome]|uniref:UDP-N-acetylglucosamine 4-epimerase n=1 Tax=bioreactor metagenome TaxID=1076179 RepID=A0A644WPP6_9ZZZZ